MAFNLDDIYPNINLNIQQNLDIVDVSELTIEIDNLIENINTLQEIGLPSIVDIPKQIIKEFLENKKTERQIAKTMLMMQSPNMSEERAQLITYGKLYYKDGKLYDNDKEDPNCVVSLDDEDYVDTINENSGIWIEIKEKIKNIKESLLQLGIKIGEFLIAIPSAIATITTSLIALVSAAIILPFGSGLPTAISAVQNIIATLKELQSKIMHFLPFLGIITLIGPFLPKKSQSIVYKIRNTIAIISTIVASLIAILKLLTNLTNKLSLSKKKMDEQKFEIDVKAEPSTVSVGETVKLNASATGGDWNYKYQWIDSSGKILSDSNVLDISLKTTTTFTCKVTDGTGLTKTSSVKIKVKND